MQPLAPAYHTRHKTIDYHQQIHAVPRLSSIPWTQKSNIASSEGTRRDSRPILRLVGVVMALENELKTYEANIDKWTEQSGKFVLIHGDEVVDFFAAYEDAIKAGYQKFGLKPFLVKQINA